MFNDPAFRQRHNLAGVNSINWGRILVQIIYYATTALSLGAPDRSLCYVVPTGNFGDIFAGYVAQRMGLPIDRLVIATNTNDILHRALSNGRYEVAGEVTPTTSPSMDIQVSSNFERLLFDALERDADALRGLMNQLQQSGGFDIPQDALAWMRQLFASGRASEEDVRAAIRRAHEDTGELVDPHTAVALHVAREHISAAHAVIALSTAHPAKFPEAVRAATGVEPQLPAHLASIMEAEEHYTVLPAKLDEVQAFIAANAESA
jgi:threonine synthase